MRSGEKQEAPPFRLSDNLRSMLPPAQEPSIVILDGYVGGPRNDLSSLELWPVCRDQTHGSQILVQHPHARSSPSQRSLLNV